MHLSGKTLRLHNVFHSCARRRDVGRGLRSLDFIRTFSVNGVRLQREHGAHGDDVERQSEVGHVELAQKVSKGAA